jgi:hypothetical protein
MTRQSRMRMRYAVAMLVVAGLYLANDEGISARAGAANAGASRAVGRAAAGSDGNCDESCGPDVSCDQGCWAWADQLPTFHTTCGEYGGGPWNGFGNCIGTCGDAYCNEYNDEDMDTCYQDCGECGDNVCTPYAEDAAHCYDDCGYCGDGICSPSEECGASNQCSPDCGGCSSQGSQCDDLFSDCGGGERCNAQHYCASLGDRSCGGDHGCCSNEVWFALDCLWEYEHHGQTAGEACELQHCMPNYGCGECIPSGPMIPRPKR